MPIAAIGLGLGTALAGGAAAGATIYGSHQQSSAAKRAADIQAKATAEATALAREQEAERKKEYDAQQAEAKRQWDVEQQNKAPYRQVSQDALFRVRDLLGLPQTAVPSGPSDGPSTTAPVAAGPAPNIDWTQAPDALHAQLSDFFKSRGVSDKEAPYWVSKAAELVARGKEINDPNYATKRLLAADVFGGGSSTASRPAASMAMPPAMLTAGGPATNASYAPIIPFSALYRS